jgi:hypothetical protein
MQLKRRDVRTGLAKLGTISQGGNHEKCRVVLDGKCVAVFPIPSNGDFDDKLISLVSGPLAVSNRSFGEICGCTKGQEWYRTHLSSAGKL